MTNTTVRWIIFLADLIGAVLALVLLVAPAKITGSALDFTHGFFIVLFLVNALCVVPFVWPATVRRA